MRQIPWEDYRDYLLGRYAKKNAMNHYNYARKYYQVLTKERVELIRKLNGRKLDIVLQALNSLAEFLGMKKVWQDIRERYGIKVEHKIDFDPFEEEDITEMITWYREALSIAPEPIKNTLSYALITGLRPGEALESIRAVREGWKEYIREMDGFLVLQHFKHPDVFIRRSKRAYISVVEHEDLALAENAELSYDKIRNFFKREAKMAFYMKYARKIYSTYLREGGIKSEMIDLLQGRVKARIFTRHYYRPDMQEKLREVLEVVIRLKKEVCG